MAPQYPVLASPLNGAVDQPTELPLAWDCVAGATGYDVQIGTSCGVGTWQSTESCSVTVSGLSTNTEYFWRVRSNADCGVTGDPSPCWSFTTAPCETEIPELLLPSDGATCLPTEVALDWGDVPGALEYEVQLGTSCGEGAVYSTAVTDTTVADLVMGASYYWRVRAKGYCGIWGSWSECRSFSTTPEAPGVPVLAGPPNGWIDVPKSVYIAWDCVPEATGYELQIGTSCGTGDIYSTGYCGKDVWGLTANTEYFWRVRAKRQCDVWGEWSECWSFLTIPADNSDGMWVLHFAGPRGSEPPDCTFPIPNCWNAVVDATTAPGRYDIYVLAIDVEEIAGTRFSLDCGYPGSKLFYGWTGCADIEDPTPGWPGCDEAISMTWSSPQSGPYVTVGILDVYIYPMQDYLRVEPDPRTGFAEWCDGREPVPNCYQTSDWDVFGAIGFGMPGYNPCGGGPVPVQLDAIEVTPTDEGVLLEWASSDVSDFTHFFVHRSAADPSGNFVKLHREPLKGDGWGSMEYSYLDTDVMPGTIYYYKLEGVQAGGGSVYFGPYTALAAGKGAKSWLAQNSPNPFNSGCRTTIDYSVENGGAVKLRIMDVAGRLVRTITQEAVPGENRVTWDGTDQNGNRVPGGVYFYEIEARGFTAERKMLVLE
jgi:hypothetical protein